jgi:hypothetical protein
VFWAGRKGLCFVFLCFEPAQRACVLCFRVLADPPQNTGGGQLHAYLLKSRGFDKQKAAKLFYTGSCSPAGATLVGLLNSPERPSCEFRHFCSIRSQEWGRQTWQVTRRMRALPPIHRG